MSTDMVSSDSAKYDAISVFPSANRKNHLILERVDLFDECRDVDEAKWEVILKAINANRQQCRRSLDYNTDNIDRDSFETRTVP